MPQQCVIYQQPNGKIAVLAPTPEALQNNTILDVAKKDVPTGVPFKILDIADLPSDPQVTWEVDDEDLDDGVGT